jgi:hypothetical protein
VDEVFASDKGLSWSTRHIQQLLRGDFCAPEPLADLSADQDIDIRAIEARGQQHVYRRVQDFTRTKDTNHLAYFYPVENLSDRTAGRHGLVLLAPAPRRD